MHFCNFNIYIVLKDNFYKQIWGIEMGTVAVNFFIPSKFILCFIKNNILLLMGCFAKHGLVKSFRACFFKNPLVSAFCWTRQSFKKIGHIIRIQNCTGTHDRIYDLNPLRSEGFWLYFNRYGRVFWMYF